MNVIRYKGFSAQPEYSEVDGVFYGKILGINDLVDFWCDDAKDLETEFRKTVDDYLEFCAEIEKIPADANLPKRTYKAERAVRAMYRLGEAAKKDGTATMTLEEINAEIVAARKEFEQKLN